MREQMLLTRSIMMRRSSRFSSVDVKTVLTLLGETYRECDYVVVGHQMAHVLGQSFLFNAIFMQRRHEVRQRSRHPELDLQFTSREHQRFLRFKREYYYLDSRESKRFISLIFIKLT